VSDEKTAGNAVRCLRAWHGCCGMVCVADDRDDQQRRGFMYVELLDCLWHSLLPACVTHLVLLMLSAACCPVCLD
jgi:hypothetical protein